MTIYTITSPDFWEQPRLTLTLILGLYLLCAAIICYAFYAVRHQLAAANKRAGRFWQSASGTAFIRVARILISLAGVATLVISVRGSGDMGLGGIILLAIWPVVIAQIAMGFLPWEKYIRADSDKGALFIALLFLAGIVDYTLYVTAVS